MKTWHIPLLNSRRWHFCSRLLFVSFLYLILTILLQHMTERRSDTSIDFSPLAVPQSLPTADDVVVVFFIKNWPASCWLCIVRGSWSERTDNHDHNTYCTTKGSSHFCCCVSCAAAVEQQVGSIIRKKWHSNKEISSTHDEVEARSRLN